MLALKKIQARPKERSCFITACIHDTNEMEILIKAKRQNGNKKQRQMSTYRDMNLREQDTVQMKAIIDNDLTISRFQNPVIFKIAQQPDFLFYKLRNK